MSEKNMYRSSGSLIKGSRKIRGDLVASERSACFTSRKETIELSYPEIALIKNERNGGMASTLTIKMKDGQEYVFMLSNGLKVYHYMEGRWDNRPRILSHADELHRLAEMRGERIVKPRRRLLKRRRPNRSLYGDLGIYRLRDGLPAGLCGQLRPQAPGRALPLPADHLPPASHAG